MNGFEIILSREHAQLDEETGKARAARLRLLDAPNPDRPRVRDAIDIVVGGVNLTARVAADQAPCVLRDLALSLVDLGCGVRSRAIVRFYDVPWELGLERREGDLALSLVKTGDETDVAVHDRRTPIADAIAGTRAAISALLTGRHAHDALAEVLRSELEGAEAALGQLEPGASTPPARHDVLAVVEPEPGIRCAFGVELPLSVDAHAGAEASVVETSDLHALLGRGRMRAVVRGRAQELGEVHGFLATERLVELAKAVLDAWERGRPLHTKVSLQGPLVGVRLDATGTLSLTLVASENAEAPRSTHVFPSLEGPDFVDAAVSLGRQLVRTIVRRDRAQASNLRLLTLRRRVRELSERLRDVARPVGPFGESDLVNQHRDSYRPYVKAKATTGAPDASLRRLKYEPRWTAEVPGIDLRATFLCGDRLVLSGASQTACVDRVTGKTLWKAPTVRATQIPTPAGLARLRGDGRLELRDFGDGSVVWTADCAPRSKGTPAACTIIAPGLPRLLVATDGDRHLCAYDLTSGAPRWRYTMTRPGPVRVRRAGRLLVVSSDEAQLVALDAVDGRVVWRIRDRLRFAAPAAIEREELFVVAGEPGGLARLHHLDALSGARRWERILEGAVATESAPMPLGRLVVVVTRDRRGIGLSAIDQTSGVEAWSLPPGTFPPGTSALGIDDRVVLNLPTGEVSAIVARDGSTAWRHVFETPVHGDAPRRLEPVLRAGALFVPQDRVRVLRPSDGAIVGVVTSDLVPDLLRVDERCDVYVAEESGHVAAFGAQSKLEAVPGRPRLSLVR